MLEFGTDVRGRLVGRGDELAGLLGLLTDPDARMVSIIGPPGVGKTTLAAASAAELRGVAAVCLDPDDHEAYEDCGVPCVAARPELVGEALRYAASRASIVILDSADQPQRDSDDGVGGELGARLISVSRSPLHRRDERRFMVRPLRVPEPGGGVRTSGMELLMLRASAVRPDIELTTATAGPLASISRLCGGIPLALELAASRLRSVDAGELLLQLSNPLPVLAGGGPALLRRHRALGTALTSAWTALDAGSARLATVVALLDGPFTVEDVEETCDLAGVDVDSLTATSALVDVGLLLTAGHPGLLVMPWPWRAYALTHLDMEVEKRLRVAIVPALRAAGTRRPALGVLVALRAARVGDPVALDIADLLPGSAEAAPSDRDVFHAFVMRCAGAALAADAQGATDLSSIASLAALWGASELGLSDVRERMLDVQRWAATRDVATLRVVGRGRQSTSRRVLAAVLYTTVAAAAAAPTDSEWLEVVRTQEALLRSLVTAFGGYNAHVTGVGVAVALFDGPASAIGCGLELLASAHQLGLIARGGIHLGDVEILDEDVAGLSVHVAARVAGHAGPGELLLTEMTRDAAGGSGVGAARAMVTELKGLPGRWTLYRALAQGSGGAASTGADYAPR